MSTVTIRASQNTYTFDQTGGTRDPQYVLHDRVEFMDAIEAERTEVLDSMKKGAASTIDRPRWGLYSVSARGSVLGALAADNATSFTLPTGHSARFQQGHTLMVKRKADGEYGTFWVNSDPGNDTLNVTPISSPQLAFAEGDEIVIIGVAMPQGSDFPLAPITKGRDFYNLWQEFSGHIEHTLQSDKTPSVDNPTGNNEDRDMLQLGRDMKQNLSQALLFGVRRTGTPNPATKFPSMMGGMLQMAEIYGNTYDIGGDDVNLTPDALAYVLRDIKRKFKRSGNKWLMSYNTKVLLNRIADPLKWQAGNDSGTIRDKWDKYETEAGTIEFTWIEDFPDGVILVYEPKNLQYIPYAGADWKEISVPTKGFHSWRGIGGIYTLTAKDAPAMALIRGFNQNIADYPSLFRPASFLVA